MKSGAVHLDDEDRGLPLDAYRIVLESAEADEHVAGLGPGRLEVPVTRRHRFPFRLADLIDMDLAVTVVRDPRRAGRAGLFSAGDQRRDGRPHPQGGRDRYGTPRGLSQELTSTQRNLVIVHGAVSPMVQPNQPPSQTALYGVPGGLSCRILLHGKVVSRSCSYTSYLAVVESQLFACWARRCPVRYGDRS